MKTKMQNIVIYSKRLTKATRIQMRSVCIVERGGAYINGTHFGYCDEGCAEPRKLGEGMKCVDGRIFGVRMWREGEGNKS
jgi:hypothetical protein